MSLEYSGQSLSDLLSLEEDYDGIEIVSAVSQAVFAKYLSLGLADVPEVFVFAVAALQREVFNGGYDQFFRNSSGVVTPIIVDALRALGADEVRRITERAIDAVGSSEPERIDEILYSDDGEEERDAELERCDRLYYAHEDANDGELDALLLEYIKKNRHSIELSSPVRAPDIPAVDDTGAEAYATLRKTITRIRLEARQSEA